MPVVPVLMVLYADSSTEVRYSDGARLILSPCGSAFRYQLPPSADRHPIQGVEVIQQRSAFVTSQFRQKVIEALDFRNRFAASPYICPQLFPKENIILLHSNVVEVTWPESHEDTEVLEDGSIKLTSRDEHASLILSPHGHDVTICYLSKVSTPPPTRQPELSKRKHSSPAEFRSRHVSGGSNSGLSDKSDSSSRTKSKSNRHSKKSRSKTKPNGAQFGTLSVQPSVYSAFVKVPKRPSSHSRQSSNPKYSDGESSTNSLQSLDSVTSSVEDELCSSYRDLNIQCKTQPGKISTSNHGMSVPKCQPSSHLHRIGQSNCPSLNASPNLSPISRDVTNADGQSNSSPTNSLLPENQSKCRQYYCWVTQHVSCSDCPLFWSYPIHLVQQKWEALQQKSYHSGVQNGRTISSTTTKDSKCRVQVALANGPVSSQLPPPVPLSCPGQHLHSWSSDLDLPSASGKVKVLMSEGVIYRLIRQPSLRRVEIYPGDNSVVSSQGLTGHFFRHVIPRVDNSSVEEKMYSVQVPPLDHPGLSYSLARLIQKGAQLFSSISQEGGTVQPGTAAFCWQFQDEIGEELSVPGQVIKDEHSVPGLGRFLAFTNGKIRVVFADRTALDMVSHDHSPGCHGDHNHSTSEVSEWSVHDSNKARVWGELIPLGYCRLLLPSGDYTLVSLQSPGPYKMYVDYALEWAAWSATPVKHRAEFYATRSNTHTDFSPDSELRKINCFNYVVENTVLKQKALCTSGSGDFGHFVSNGLGHSASRSLSRTPHSVTQDSHQIQSFDDVRRALQKTSQVIHDIDSLLSTQK